MNDETNDSVSDQTECAQDQYNSRKNGDRESSGSHSGMADDEKSTPSNASITHVQTKESTTDSEASVEVLVSAEDDEAIPNATVSLSGMEFATKDDTSQTGRCTLMFPANAETVVIEVTHPDYESVSREFAIPDGAVIDVVLGKASETTKTPDKVANDGESDSPDDSESKQKPPTRLDLLAELVRLNEEHSQKVTRSLIRSDGVYKPEDYEDEFGSWSAALEATSVPDQEGDRDSETGTQPNQRYTKEEVLEAIAEVIDIVDGRPNIIDMKKHGKISPSPAYHYFDSWSDAVNAAKKWPSKQQIDTKEQPTGLAANETQSETNSTDPAEPEDATVDSNGESNVSSADFAKLTSFQRDLLLVINGLSDPKGLAIKEELEQYYDDEIHHGRLYPNLDTLVEKGLIKKTARDERSNQYELTEYGTAHLEERRRWQQRCIDQHRTQESHDKQKPQPTSKAESREHDVTTERTASVEETADDDQDRLSESPEPEQKAVQTSDRGEIGAKHDPLAGDITEAPEERLTGVVLEVIQKRNIDGDNRDAVFEVETAGGERIDLTLWSKHDVRVDFTAGDAIKLDEARLKRWETDHGYAHRLSSTKDLKITLLDEDTEAEATEVDSQPETEPFIGVGGATKGDAKALLEAGYTSLDDLRDDSLEELRSISGLDDGTALRIKAELG